MCHGVNSNNNQSYSIKYPVKGLVFSTFITVAACTLSLFSPQSDAAASTQTTQQTPAINRDGVKVWTYKLAGNPALSYQASTLLNSSVSQTLALIMNHKTAPDWAPYVRLIEVISPLSREGVMIYRMEIDLPFPLTDRDVVIRSELKQQKTGEVVLENIAINDTRAPEREGLVRIKHYQGSWQLRMLTPTQLELRTEGYADLGGAIPVSFSNLFVTQQPYQMLVNLRRYLQENTPSGLASSF
ncbi:hypothetical protein [Agitococcus lubricus]|uniref:START domain-containing protein n=1 Tax=Agitococcus lubricus TaxID=1077255 RepID=A0A2T5J2X4_9GAMM|nr:hypothetical protein [Agitococcus lubricus]PTQ90945.1 hypothetical protein C8N29_10114 [Agitococcus lubricus]